MGFLKEYSHYAKWIERMTRVSHIEWGGGDVIHFSHA
jgi:hypothetical protein